MMGMFEPMSFSLDEDDGDTPEFSEKQGTDKKDDAKPQAEIDASVRADAVQAELELYKKQLSEEKAEKARLLDIATRQRPAPAQAPVEKKQTSAGDKWEYGDDVWANNPNEVVNDMRHKLKDEIIADMDAKRQQQQLQNEQARKRQESAYLRSGSYAIDAFADRIEGLSVEGSEANKKWAETIQSGIQSGKWRPEDAPFSAAKEMLATHKKPIIDDSGRQARVKAGAMHTDRRAEKASPGNSDFWSSPTGVARAKYCKENGIDPKAYQAAIESVGGDR